jgi:hypothetical protein
MSDTIKRLRLLETHLSNSGKPVWSRDVKRAAFELAAKDAAIEAAISALRAVVHDRPSALTDQIWQQANATLAQLEQVKK